MVMEYVSVENAPVTKVLVESYVNANQQMIQVLKTVLDQMDKCVVTMVSVIVANVNV